MGRTSARASDTLLGRLRSRVRRYMSDQGFETINSLANEIGFPQKTLDELMKTRTPKLDTVEQLAACMDMDPADLLGFEPQGHKDDLYESIAGALTERQLKDLAALLGNVLRLGFFEEVIRLVAHFLETVAPRIK